MIVVDRPVENMQIHEHLQYGQQKENIELRILLKENTALLSTVRPLVSVHRRDISTFLNYLMI